MKSVRNTNQATVFKLPAISLQGSLQRDQEREKEITGKKQTEEPQDKDFPPQTELNDNIKICRYARRLKNFSQAWENITGNNTILKWLKGVPLQFRKKPKQF
ncbi:hypothetical protein ABEB36_009516 [Hypothenemus hampei]|uniref:Uncharacterized protein n=1 Tax=Hypothenemus hampei TaxID=57062 RepID=A0ABD1EGL1_HYPHA